MTMEVYTGNFSWAIHLTSTHIFIQQLIIYNLVTLEGFNFKLEIPNLDFKTFESLSLKLQNISTLKTSKTFGTSKYLKLQDT